MDYTEEVQNEISFILYNYKNINKLINKRKKEILDTLNDSKFSRSKSKTQTYGYTMEDIIIKLDEDDRISRLKNWKKLLDSFFFYLYINDNYLLSSFCKLRYLERQNDSHLNKELNLNKEEITILDKKVKSFIFAKAKKLNLYEEIEVNKNASM